jgi:hypothetical protein
MKKIIVIFLCAVLCLSLFAGCSVTSESPSAVATPNAKAESESSTDASAPSEEAVSEEESGISGGLTSLDNAELPDTNRKLTYSASFSINTKQYDSDYNKIISELEAVGGYVEYEDSSAYSSDTGKNYGRWSSLTLRVPVDQYHVFLDRLSDIGEVVSQQKSAEDISDQYYDTESRIAVLEERKARLMEYLKTAQTTEDIIALEQEISDVLYELDKLQGSKRKMDDLIDYASVSVTLTELITPETIGSDGKPLGDRASDAFSMSMAGVGEFMENFAVFWAIALPIIIVIAIFVVIAIPLIKLIRFLIKKYRIKHPPKQVPPAYLQQPFYHMPQSPVPPRSPDAAPTPSDAQSPDKNKKA